MTQKQSDAIAYIVAAVNTLLAVSGEGYRVTTEDVVLTRRNGVTFVALRETRNAADWRNTAAYSNMGRR